MFARKTVAQQNGYQARAARYPEGPRGGLHPFDPFLLIGDPPRGDKRREAELIRKWQRGGV